MCIRDRGILGRIGLADFLLQDPVLDYITKAVLILSVVYSLLPLSLIHIFWIHSAVPLETGSFVQVRVTGTEEYDLLGEYVDAPAQ